MFLRSISIMVTKKIDHLALSFNFQVIFKHDTGRVIQCCVKFGTSEQRQKLFEQFKGTCKLIFCGVNFSVILKNSLLCQRSTLFFRKKINSCGLQRHSYYLVHYFFFRLISDDLGELIKSKYSKFLVKNFLNYG